MSEEKKRKHPNPNLNYGAPDSEVRAGLMDKVREWMDPDNILETDRVGRLQGWIFYESEIEDAERRVVYLSAEIEEMREYDADYIDISLHEYWLKGAEHRFDTYRRRREVWNRVRWVLTFAVGVIIAFSSLASLFRDGCW